MPASEYVDAKDMIERAREYEKIADEVEAMEDIKETGTQESLEEFKKSWGAVEVEGKTDEGQDKQKACRA